MWAHVLRASSLNRHLSRGGKKGTEAAKTKETWVPLALTCHSPLPLSVSGFLLLARSQLFEWVLGLYGSSPVLKSGFQSQETRCVDAGSSGRLLEAFCCAGGQAAAASVGTWLSHRLPGREEFARHLPTQAENFEVLTESCPWGPDKGLIQILPSCPDSGPG